MADLLATLGGLISSLGNIQSATVLKEHVALLKTALDQITERLATLEAENARLVQRNVELEEAAARQKKSTEFVEARGAAFKRLPSGVYDETPYCPSCHSAMYSGENVFPYECGTRTCRRKAGFTCGELKAVLAGLPT